MKNTFLILYILLVNPCIFQSTYQVYNSTDYSIKYDSNWITKTPQNNLVQFFTKKENEQDFFQENFNIITQDLNEKNTTLDSYSDLTIKEILDALGKDAVLGFKDIKINEVKGKEIIYTMPLKIHNRQQEMLKIKQQWCIKNGKAYLLTYTAYTNTFTKYLNTVDNMFNSFKLK